MRRTLITSAVAAAVIVLGAGPAAADPDDRRARPPQPVCPPGATIGQGDPAEQSRTPLTGRSNSVRHGQEDCPNA